MPKSPLSSNENRDFFDTLRKQAVDFVDGLLSVGGRFASLRCMKSLAVFPHSMCRKVSTINNSAVILRNEVTKNLFYTPILNALRFFALLRMTKMNRI